MKTIIKILCIALIIFSCTTSDQQYKDITTTVKIDFSKKQKNIPLSDYADSVTVVRLESTPSSLISQILKVMIFDNKIFIADKRTKSIIVFDMSGKFLYRFNKIGRGPGEYMKISNAYISRSDSSLIIRDLPQRKINYYDFNGTFIYSKTFEHTWMREMIVHDGVYYGYNHNIEGGNSYNGLFMLDKNLTFKKYLYKSSTQFETHSYTKHLQKINENMMSVCLKNENIVMNFVQDSVVSLVAFDFDDLTMSNNIKSGVIDETSVDASIYSFNDSETYTFINWRKHIDNTGFTTVYNKKNNSVNISDAIVDDITFVNGMHCTSEGPNNTIIESVSAATLLHLKEHMSDSRLNRYELNKLTINDNPYLKIIYIKNK